MQICNGLVCNKSYSFDLGLRSEHLGAFCFYVFFILDGNALMY